MATAYETSPRDRARLMEQVAKVSGGVRHDKAKGVDAVYFADDVIASCFATGEWIAWKQGGESARGWRSGGRGWVEATAFAIATAVRGLREE